MKQRQNNALKAIMESLLSIYLSAHITDLRKNKQIKDKEFVNNFLAMLEKKGIVHGGNTFMP